VRGEARCTTLADLSWLVGRFFKFHVDTVGEGRMFMEALRSRHAGTWLSLLAICGISLWMLFS